LPYEGVHQPVILKRETHDLNKARCARSYHKDRAAHAKLNRWKVIVVFKAFFDDAGTHQDSPITGIGGFVGSEVAATSLETDWQAVLDEFAEEGVRAFHSFAREWGEEDFANIKRPSERRLGIGLHACWLVGLELCQFGAPL
jgi:hypothetical protein